MLEKGIQESEEGRMGGDPESTLLRSQYSHIAGKFRKDVQHLGSLGKMQIRSTTKLGVRPHTRDFSPWEAETEHQFKAGLGCVIS